MEIIAPEIYGRPIASENNQPPKGGPIILPSESKEDNSPVALPCPDVEVFVSNEETLGRMTPFPIPKIVK